MSLWRTSNINHISQVPTKGRVVVTDDVNSDRSSAQRVEQKGVVCMKGIDGKFTLHEQTVVDPCADTSTRAEDCILVTRYRLSLSCKIDTIYLK